MSINPPVSRTIGFLLVDNFTMISQASAIEALRMANHISQQPLYQWTMLSVNGPVPVSGVTEVISTVLVMSMMVGGSTVTV